MKNKIMKVLGTLSMYMFLVASKVSATAWDTSGVTGAGDDNATTIMGKIAGFVKPISAILVFGSVLLIGFEIIMKRNKADERMASMSSLMWVGIGTLVIAFASLIASFLFDQA